MFVNASDEDKKYTVADCLLKARADKKLMHFLRDKGAECIQGRRRS